jgi:voltage-gated potassium channel
MGRVKRRGYGGLFGVLLRVTNSPRALITTYLVLLTVSGGLYALFERKGVGDALWWAVVTASTVGYGDTYPTTVPGRIIGGLLISTMVLVVIPLVTAHFASKLIVDQDAFRHEEQEEIKENLRVIRRLLEAQADPVDGTPNPPSSSISRPAGR